MTNLSHDKLIMKNNTPIMYENNPVLYPVEMIMSQGTRAAQARKLTQGDGNENENRNIARKESVRFV
ncbi:MAG: hypothetical protein A3G70_03905 [Planctomycetes bacterium RIFCSPLOWO2_12_FULL_39_13]|nr:MAG: hypothetical protein A3G70_03905 [Planctomycetes bacterium RIFCSPLOWO2_12_FULL_39_13]